MNEYKLVYVCSPYAGDIEQNVSNARKYSRFVAMSGYIPITPHLLFTQFLSDNNPEERDMGMRFGNSLMDLCSELWVFGDDISTGMKAEIQRAKEQEYKIRYFNKEMKETILEK